MSGSKKTAKLSNSAEWQPPLNGNASTGVFMNQPNEALTDQEVHRISQLIESLDRSTLDYLQVDAGGVKITISKGGAGLPTMASPAVPATAPALAASFATAPAATPTPAPRIVAPPAQADTPGTVVIPAPLMGRFYPRPEPGAELYVSVGSEVQEDTVIGLIEVMKLFNTVQAGVRGVITEICAPEGEFLDYGSPLFRVRLHDAPAHVRKGS
jgi:acetyl-CoA carboxylase biotin carboxyl carrier protein